MKNTFEVVEGGREFGLYIMLLNAALQFACLLDLARLVIFALL